MDTSDHDISFDGKGVCNHCREWDDAMKKRTLSGDAGQSYLNALADGVKASARNKHHNCVLGMSGGIDSSYAAYLAKRLGLNPWCVSVDNGYDTQVSTNNVRALCRTFDFHHEIIQIDRDEFRDLQLSYIRAGVVNLEVPSDHAINASVYRTASRLGLRHIISGQNVVTEAGMPKSWGWDNRDLVNLKSIHKTFGAVPLKTFPTMGHSKMACYTIWKRITTLPILNYADYNKAEAKRVLQEECGWIDYGAKHHESHITRWYQCYVLPKYWGIDKRRAHLSCLVRAGQMPRDEAEAELARPPCSDSTLNDDMAYVCDYLGQSQEQLDNLFAQPHHSHDEYGTAPRVALADKLYHLFVRIRGGV